MNISVKKAYEDWPWRNTGLSEQEVFEAAFWIGNEAGYIRGKKIKTDPLMAELKALLKRMKQQESADE